MKKRLLITSIVMMLVVAVALSTATYAWFTSNAGVTVTCRDERSQLQNKKKALKTLRAAVAKYYQEAQTTLTEKAKAGF